MADLKVCGRSLRGSRTVTVRRGARVR